jgi:5-formyltetrahydrofolate cyclo-ligase
MDADVLDKNTLRARALGARKAIAREQAEMAAQALAVNLFKTIPANAVVVAGYIAIHHEISVALAMNALSARAHTLCLPVVTATGQALIFRKWKPGDPLEKGAYGIDVPLASAEEVLPDVVIVPLAAFDLAGHRLGYGAGYYDKTIAKMRAQKKDILLIGAAYAQQQIPYIPIDEHDRKLDAIATEKGILTPA